MTAHLTGAACATTPHADEIFHPNKTGPINQQLLKLARNICAGCPAKTDCLTEAQRLGHHAQGIWGGLTDSERAKLRQSPTPPLPRLDWAKCGTPPTTKRTYAAAKTHAAHADKPNNATDETESHPHRGSHEHRQR